MNNSSAFAESGLAARIEQLCEEIRELYVADKVPWIIGYSGGKDSTAVLQLVWRAIRDLVTDKRGKPIYVISTDTMVENPVVAAWVERSHVALREAAAHEKLPFVANLLRPQIDESFWVNLIGKGYPAPRRGFRWCTERLKIQPSNRFISRVVTENGEAILLLGARKAESSARAKVMARASKHQVRDRISPSTTLPGCLIYSPIEDWSNDDVWLFLMQFPNPWGHENKSLLGMYRGATSGGECPVVVDTSTPSCGDSRFGCWVCTLVEQDKSMTAMVQNDQDKEWMQPLLDLRNELDLDDHHLRDFRRMSGVIQLMNRGEGSGEKLIPGPYTQTARIKWLRKLLSAQTWIRQHGPNEVRSITLVSLDELEEIRRIWVTEKHEFEDCLPQIFEETTSQPYPGQRFDDNPLFGAKEMHLLREICGDDQAQFELLRELLSVERQQRADVRRSGIIDRLEKSIRRHYYKDEADALDMARRYAAARKNAEVGQQAIAFEQEVGIDEEPTTAAEA
jgi:DNA sulfur modification protein DndC